MDSVSSKWAQPRTCQRRSRYTLDRASPPHIHGINREYAVSIEQKLNRALSAILDAKADLEGFGIRSENAMQIRRAVNELDIAELDIENAIRELSGELC